MPRYDFDLGGRGPNAMPLALSGPIIRVRIQVPMAVERVMVADGSPLPPPISGVALVDTGATTCAVNESSIRGLGVNPIGVIRSGSTAGLHTSNVYPGRITLIMPSGEMEVEHGRLAGVNLDGAHNPGGREPLIALLGRDFLQDFTMLYNGTLGTWTLFH